MTSPPKIGVFYSHGPHFVRILKLLRKDRPEATIVAFIPPAFPEAHIVPIVSACRVAPAGGYSLAHPANALKTLQLVRAEGLDQFIIMFDSPKLRLFAALSGARSRSCHLVDGRTTAVRFQVIRPLLSAVYRRVRGQITYWRIRRMVYGTKVE